MNVSKSLMGLAMLAVAVPVWAHCGVCGKGEKTEKIAKHEHSHQRAEVGKAAPDFELKDVDGTAHKLSDLKGKIVVLEWTNHQCPVVKRCHKSEIIKKTRAQFKDKPVAWLAIDSSHFCKEKIDKVREWNEEQKIDYPVLLDAAGKVGHRYKAKTTPHMFVIDKNGVLAYSGAIDDDPYGQNADVRDYVVEVVSALLKGSTVTVVRTKPYGCSVQYKDKAKTTKSKA